MEKLRDNALVKTGLVLARKQIRQDQDNAVVYKQLNLKAIDEKGFLKDELLDTFEASEKLKIDYITQPRDIVVRLTFPYTAILIDEKTKGLVIPSHFVVIRIIGNRLLPEYLYWLLNTEKVKNQLAQNTSSSFIGTVRPAQISDLDIDMISVEEQYKIAKINELARRELHLLEELIQVKETYYKETIKQLQKEMRNKGND